MMNRSSLGLSDPQDPVLIFCRFDDGLSARSSLAVNDPWICARKKLHAA
jgi:hypothetical protein